MGSSNSKCASKEKAPKKDFVESIRTGVEDEIARRMMLQREVQMAVQVAKARDTIYIFGSAWATLVVGSGMAQVAGRKPPPFIGVPIVVGALVLGNMADMAYGNKLLRVTKEAEHLMSQDRGRFVPMKQAAFHKFYTDEERAAYYDRSTAVGDLFPNYFVARSSSASSPK